MRMVALKIEINDKKVKNSKQLLLIQLKSAIFSYLLNDEINIFDKICSSIILYKII